MEALYKKLYDKYSDLKRKKDSEIEELNRDQELKFLKHMSAADELIEHLSNENGMLRAENNDLRSEVLSIRSAMDKQYAESQMLIMEEIQKNKELSKEIEKLQDLQQTDAYCSSRGEKSEDREPCAEILPVDKSNGSTVRMTRKRARHSKDMTKDSVGTPSSSCPVDQTMSRNSARDQSMESSGANIDIEQPECCKRTTKSSGAGGQKLGAASCLFQVLTECLIGMKLSAVNQAEGMCITALHPSSGYSFSLTWITKPGGKEVELLYRVSSLGTFEKVAPEWMREVILFSMNMCPIFFERLSRVVKLRH